MFSFFSFSELFLSLCHGVQSSLEGGDCSAEFCWVESRVYALEVRLDCWRDAGLVQEPLVGGAGLVVELFELGSGSGFLHEFHDRLEVVGEQCQRTVEFLEHVELLLSLETIVADGTSYDTVVLLLDETTIVLAVWSAPGEGDVVVAAEDQEVLVDKL